MLRCTFTHKEDMTAAAADVPMPTLVWQAYLRRQIESRGRGGEREPVMLQHFSLHRLADFDTPRSLSFYGGLLVS